MSGYGRLGSLAPRFRGPAMELLKVAGANGIVLQVTSTRRTRAKQARLYKAYLAGKLPYTVLPPGSSLHELGLAIDVYTPVTTDLRRLGAWWRSVGGTWGGEADPVHFGAPRSWWP